MTCPPRTSPQQNLGLGFIKGETQSDENVIRPNGHAETSNCRNVDGEWASDGTSFTACSVLCSWDPLQTGEPYRLLPELSPSVFPTGNTFWFCQYGGWLISDKSRSWSCAVEQPVVSRERTLRQLGLRKVHGGIWVRSWYSQPHQFVYHFFDSKPRRVWRIRYKAKRK